MTDLNMDVMARVQKLEAENAAMRAETLATKARLNVAQRRARISAGLGFSVMVGTLLVSPGSRSALAQEGLNLYNAFKRIAAIEAVNRTQDTRLAGHDTQIADLYARLKNIQLTPGPKGDKGDKGDKGATGAQGLAGAKGDKGDKGATGDKGAQGLAGAKGDKGDKGDKGATGDKGAQGLAGAKGDKGDKGAQGLAGAKGDKGDKGLPGKDGMDADMTRVANLENLVAEHGNNIQSLFFITSHHSDQINYLIGTSATKSDFNNLQTQVIALTNTVDKYDLVARLFHVDLNGQTLFIGGPLLQTVRFEGVNLQVVNGMGSNDQLNGLGNIIVGYNPADPFSPPTRGGSHNLVLSDNNSYSSYGGFVSGMNNFIAAPGASICGGANNKVTGQGSVIGGAWNKQLNDIFTFLGN